MKSIYETTLRIIDCAIHNHTLQLEEKPDWSEIYSLLLRARLDGVTYRTVSELPSAQQPDSELLSYWKKQVLKRGVRQIMANQELKYVLAQARQRHINLIVFKGASLAALYPEPNMRFSSDSDLLVSSGQRSAAEDMLNQLGYTYYPEASKEYVPVYRIRSGNRRLSIELHERLWEDYTGKQVNLLASLRLDAPESFLSMDACDIPITTLGYEEHLVFQIFHIAKHFSLEGLRLSYLADIVLYVNAYFSHIDFQHFQSVMKELKYDMFCDFLFKLGVTYLGMNPLALSEEYRDLPLNEHVLEDLFMAGQTEEDPGQAWASTELIASYFTRNTAVASTSKKQTLRTFFPAPGDLKDKFAYAKKYPLLLPLAWIHRFASAFRYTLHCRKHNLSSTKVLNKANQRISLMNQIGMLDKSNKEQ